MEDLETILYEERGAVAWVTLNRPDVYNAFNEAMQRELHAVWRHLRTRDDIRCAVLTGAGEKAFCTGIDRAEGVEVDDDIDPATTDIVAASRGTSNPFMYDDPGDMLGPKSSDLWKPVVAAVNGMACGGAFYMLGEADIIIAADHATFFDPHVTYGMAAVYEPTFMLQKMPFGEIMRMSLLGNYERMTAATAERIGLVTDVVPADQLAERAAWLADSIASQPADAVQTTLRALWMAQEVGRAHALQMAPSILFHGLTSRAMAEGQELFNSGTRIKPNLR